MDVETSDAIETLRGDIRRVDRTVKGVASQVVEINAKLTTVDAKLATVDTQFATVDGKLSVIDAKLDELRVHTHVLNEAVRDDIRMVAEAVAVLAAKSSTR